MAFDAGMVAAVADECSRILAGARVEKIMQPSADEIIFLLHTGNTGSAERSRDVRLLVSASAARPRVHITSSVAENPAVPPNFCMLLRKYLLGSRLVSAEQCGFERVIRFTFEACDPLGYTENMSLYAEIMGKYSNAVLCDGNGKILGACKPVDFTTSSKRQVLPGMNYELPPSQGKLDPLTVDGSAFDGIFSSGISDESDPGASPADRGWDRMICDRFEGIAKVTAQEIVFRAGGSKRKLREEFLRFTDLIRQRDFRPTLLLRTAEGSGGKEQAFDYSFLPIGQYGSSVRVEFRPSFGELLDEFYTSKDIADRMRQRASDIFRLLSNAETRLKKKCAAQRADLAECEKKDELRASGDLITANIYRIKKGDREAELTDYYSEDLHTVKITLDPRLTPSQNAQRYYKKYAKAKSAEVALREQLEISEGELSYIETVFDSLTRAEKESDLEDIRAELYESGFASRMKNYDRRKNLPKSKPDEYRTDGGCTVFSGRNNTQNDRLTFRLCEKGDWWFHVHGAPGSHVVMLTPDSGEEPSALDFTQAAIIAATNSSLAESRTVTVDYTNVKNIKKPPGAKPGYVIYHTNWSAYVDPDPELVRRLRVSK